MKDVYFDTSTLITELFAPKTNSKYNTTNSSYEPWISPVVKQELFHVMANEKAHNSRGTNRSYSDARKKMSQFLMKTRMVDTSSTEVLRKYEGAVSQIHQHFDDIPEKYDSEFPGSSDLMHFSYARVKECETLVTMDDDYCTLKGLIDQSEVNKIIVLNPRTHKKENEVILS